MVGRISDDILQTIRERVSIVEIVSGYVTLRQTGRNYLGLCPFHAEKTPSFTVNDDRGLFHCFGCGAGGTVFTFLMRADRIEFREAVEVLAKRAGIELPRIQAGSPGQQARQGLANVNEAAQEYFAACIRSARGAAAREYLTGRGVKPETIAKYGIGFSPDGSGLIRFLNTKELGLQNAGQLGLIGRRGDGSAYDRFWGRVTFPIRDTAGRIVGFGGRTLGSGHPKYLNSPESALFHKAEVLYGLFEARQAIREAERVVIVEGYLDALALVESGIGFAVASLGTALGVSQLRLARRFAPEVVAFFDGDRAGQAAAVRAFSVCAEAGVWGLGAFLPEGFDPDTFVRANGSTATLSLLQHAVPLADFFIESNNPGASASVPERVRAAQKIAEILKLVKEPTQFSLLARKAAQQLGVDEEVFRVRRAAPASTPRVEQPQRSVSPSQPPPAFRNEELLLVETMGMDRKIAQLVEESGILEHFESPLLRDGGRTLALAWRNQGRVDGALDQLPGVVAERVTAGLVGGGSVADVDRAQLAEQCIARIESRLRRAEARVLREQIERAEARGDRSGSLEALRRADQLRQRRSPQPS